ADFGVPFRVAFAEAAVGVEGGGFLPVAFFLNDFGAAQAGLLKRAALLGIGPQLLFGGGGGWGGGGGVFGGGAGGGGGGGRELRRRWRFCRRWRRRWGGGGRV